ncbi:MAG TPA: cyanophycin synthetase [Solirubrobacterales bacterium]|nr:cyanophycin synthetase [Solirubrobacterales bacterium]
MHRLTTVLGMPQHRFASIHVVGTNGKSSVTRMIAALLEAHGVSAGACVSPHASRWSERTLVHGEEIGAAELAAAVERVAQAAEVVNRTLDEGEAVTQFEAATAVTFVALAAARVQAAAIEAGLGGRLDATNTIHSRVTVLTSIGLDHTEWLGETEAEIAAEKLAVLRDHSILVLGRVSAEVVALAEGVAAERGARLAQAPEDPGPELRLRASGAFQRRNFALALAAAEAFLGDLDAGRVAEVAATLAIPGRLEKIATGPPTFIDAAHNPDGAVALAEALPAIAAGGPVVACLAILADKDAEAMARALAPVLDRAVCAELPAEALSAQGRPGAASHPAAELAEACEAAGLPAEPEPSFPEALRRARELASEPPGGTLLVTGSHYVLAPARAATGLWED